MYLHSGHSNARGQLNGTHKTGLSRATASNSRRDRCFFLLLSIISYKRLCLYTHITCIYTPDNNNKKSSCKKDSKKKSICRLTSKKNKIYNVHKLREELYSHFALLHIVFLLMGKIKEIGKIFNVYIYRLYIKSKEKS